MFGLQGDNCVAIDQMLDSTCNHSSFKKEMLFLNSLAKCEYFQANIGTLDGLNYKAFVQDNCIAPRQDPIKNAPQITQSSSTHLCHDTTQT